MLYLQPEESAHRWRLSFVGTVYADDNFFSKVEEEQRKMPPGDRTLIVDIRKLEEITNPGQEVLSHLFQRMHGHGFRKANLIARRQQKHVIKIFERILDQVFGPDGTISCE
ncbi:MAG TPA: hypothetical protein PL066_04205 [bacterium]|nr:hypothetical protein [bacterium]